MVFSIYGDHFERRKVFIDKVQFSLDGIIGHQYGSMFEVKDGEMVKIDRTETDPASKCKFIW